MKCTVCGHQLPCQRCNLLPLLGEDVLPCMQQKGELWVVVKNRSGKVLKDIAVVATETQMTDTVGFTGYKNLDPGLVQVSLRDYPRFMSQGGGGLMRFDQPINVNIEAGSVSNVTLYLLEELSLDKVDHHFAPQQDDASDERLKITYSINRLEDFTVVLRITSPHHDPAIVFERELTAAEKASGNGKELRFKGAANCAGGDFRNGRLIDGLHGPYEVQLVCTDLVIETRKLETRVLYHSVKFCDDASYLPVPGTPPAVDTLEWVQWRLNLLGYFAGPVTGVHDYQTRRAIKRYTYEMIDHPETLTWTGRRFLDSVATDALKVTLLDNPGVITDPGAKSKAFVQTNYTFRTLGQHGTDDYTTVDGHWFRENDYTAAEGGKLDRFELPLEVRVLIVSRTQASGATHAEGVDSPEAVGTVKIEWSFTDPPEDVSVLPPFTATSPSNTRSYINEVRQLVSGSPTPDAAGDDNCPPECGGPSADWFRPGYAFRPFHTTPGAGPRQALTAVHQDPAKPAKLGRAGVIFRGSNIAGDNFVIHASIDSTGAPNQLDMESSHAAFHSKGSFKNLITQRTGQLTIWRKRRVTAIADWHDVNLGDPDWSGVVESFKQAHVELDVSDALCQPITHWVPNAADADPFLDALANWRNNGERAKFTFNPTQILPLTLVQGNNESESAFRERLVTGGDIGSNMTRLTAGSTVFPGRASLGEWLRDLVVKTRRPGFIIARVLPKAGCDVYAKSKFSRTRKLVQSKVDRSEGSGSSGVGGGVAVLSLWHLKGTVEDGHHRKYNFKEDFLYAHEMAHTLYIVHPSNSLIDHDPVDINCTMHYVQSGVDALVGPPARAGRPAVTPNMGSVYTTRFCGKCNLKLRGWKVGDPAAQVRYPPTPLTQPVRAHPVNPRMKLSAFNISELTYAGTDNALHTVQAARFVHTHTITWESSDGVPTSLDNVLTREHVRFERDTQSPPFSDWADPSREYWFSGNPEASIGPDNAGISGARGNADEHSMFSGAFIVRRPLQEGAIEAEQWYEFSVDNGGTWERMPEACYTLRKWVRRDPKHGWVLGFGKSSRAPANPNPFRFEVEYKIAEPPAVMPHDRLKPQGPKGLRPGKEDGTLTWYPNSTHHASPENPAQIKQLLKEQKNLVVHWVLEQ